MPQLPLHYSLCVCEVGVGRGGEVALQQADVPSAQIGVFGLRGRAASPSFAGRRVRKAPQVILGRLLGLVL